MSLESKSKELKEIIGKYDTQWLLGNLSELISAGPQRANDQLGKLSSPMRQLYYLAGLLVSSDSAGAIDTHYNDETWNQIVTLLNEIESEYDKLFFPKQDEIITEEWKHIRRVAMPSFLSYFNQGPLNFEEQPINWVNELFTPLNGKVEAAIGVKTENLIEFYNNLDQLVQNNFQSFAGKSQLLRPNWKKYTKVQLVNTAPKFLTDSLPADYMILPYFMADRGMIERFFPQELVTATLPIDKVMIILQQLSITRASTDYLYYTSTKPGNPLLEKPIVSLEDGMYQVFEVKQVIHAIQNLLELKVTSNVPDATAYVDKKGKLLEDKIVKLFKRFFGDGITVFTSYYVDGCEQDILILWDKYAFIIEGKGYELREPLRDPNRAFVRIKDDFKKCIGYGYEQTRRVEEKFISGLPLRITNANHQLITEIDTTKFEYDFSIIVNLNSFGQVQIDLSTLLQLPSEDDIYPWAVKFDDLEIFLLTLKAKKVEPIQLVNFLLMREELHGKLICSDELEVCGGFLAGRITDEVIENSEVIMTTPDLGDIFDEQYQKGMGFTNEKLLGEKKSGKYIFW